MGWCVRCAVWAGVCVVQCGLVCALCMWAGVCVVQCGLVCALCSVGWCVRCACGLVCALCMWAGVCIVHVGWCVHYACTHVWTYACAHDHTAMPAFAAPDAIGLIPGCVHG